MSKFIPFSAGLVIGIICLAVATGREEGTKTPGHYKAEGQRDMKFWMKQLAAPDFESRSEAHRKLLSLHDAQVHSLLILADQDSNKKELVNSQELAIQLLRHFNAPMAVPLFVRRVDFRPGLVES